MILFWNNCQAQVPFSRGVNLTGWFQVSGPRQIHFTKFTKKDFEEIKSLGCDVVRLPINLHAMTSGAPDYIPDPLFLHFLDQVVDWSEELQMHVILDNHTFDPAVNTDPAVEEPLVKVWAEMAHHFKDRSGYVYYEILNEPHGIDDAVWNNIQQRVIDAIRSKDTKHFIVVGPANWNSYHNLKNLPVYTDTKLLYTFHFYDPFVFTHQGASWTDPSLVPLAGVPFPYDPAEMPETPNTLKGTWLEGALNNYANEGNATKVRQLIDVAVAFKNERNVPLFCGEFGVFIPNSPDVGRTAWYKIVSSYLEEKGIPWTIWDYRGGFGLFEEGSAEYFEHDLNVPLLEALNFTAPPQSDYFPRPLTRGFVIYQDAFGEGISNASASGNGVLDFYSQDSPKEGNYAIYWTGASQYDAIGFDFKRDLDLSLLKKNGHTLQFFVRTNVSTAMFDVRFIDTKRDISDRPWRMGKTVTGIPSDGEWHLVQISLNDMEEKGAWDGAWYPPSGSDFDWTSIDRFEIVPEYQSLEGIEFHFDHIDVIGEEIILSAKEGSDEASGLSVYPNPVAGNAKVDFMVTWSGPLQVAIYDARGSKAKVLFDGIVQPGVHSISWDKTLLSRGLYIIRLTSPQRVFSTRISVH